jgi:hypothetical protein
MRDFEQKYKNQQSEIDNIYQIMPGAPQEDRRKFMVMNDADI